MSIGTSYASLYFLKCGAGIDGHFLPDKVYDLQYGFVLYQPAAHAS